jgi:flagellar basal-body rod protein FlgB
VPNPALPIFSLMTQRMTWLSARESVLSENIANSDTPNFAPRDLAPADFSSILAGQNGGHLVTTNRLHIGRAMAGSTPNIQVVPAAAEGGTLGSSEISLEEEMIKLSDTQLQYQTATNLYQKAVNMFRTAIGTR